MGREIYQPAWSFFVKLPNKGAMQEQTEIKPKRSGCLTIPLILVGIGLLGLILGKIGEALTSRKTSTTKLNTEVLELKSDDIGISREVLLTQLKKDGFILTKTKPHENQENYVLEDKDVEIQLIGPNDKLKSASFGVKFNGDVGKSVERLSSMVHFSSFFGEPCTNWLIQHQKEAIGKNELAYEKSEVACGRTLHLYYFSGDSMTFAVTP